MSKHEDTNLDPNQSYEANTIGFSGILYFAVGLFLLIVITFGLMWIFQFSVLEPNADAQNEKSAAKNPYAKSEAEKLPPEPRLQSAPGFGVDDQGGRIPLELREPQAEYRELMKQWKRTWEEGEKDTKTKTIISLPIKDAKERLLRGNTIKARSGEKGKRALASADFSVSSSSAGRLASEKVRK